MGGAMDRKWMDDFAVTSLKVECAKYPCLSTAHIEVGGTYPIWDGEILVHNESELSVNSFEGRVSVQIKSQGVDRLSGETRTYSGVEIKRLVEYKKEGGVLYFVVEIHKETKETKIYYAALVRYDIQEILELIPESQVSTTITLSALPSDQYLNIDIICRNFLEQRGKSIPTKIAYSQQD